MLAWLRRLTAFAALPLVAATGSLLALPLIARNVDTQDWAALTVGQSLGVITSIVVGLGWPVVGAALVAQAKHARQRQIYADSLASRAFAAAVLVPLVGVLAACLAPGEGRAVTCALMAMASALSGLSIAWFSVGRSSPQEIAIYEIAPRILGLSVAGVAVATTGNVDVYPASMGAATLGGVVVYTVRVLGRSAWSQLAAVSPSSILRRQLKLSLIETSAASYTAGLGFLAAFSLSVPELAGLGSGDRLSQVMLQAVGAISNTVHPWVAVASGKEFRRRTLRAGAVHVSAGLLFFLGIGFFGPWASALLFGAELVAPPAVCWGFGAYLLFVSVQTIVCRHVLVTRGGMGDVIRANLIAGAFGVPTVIVGARVGGASGAVIGMAAGELLISLVAISAAVRSFRIDVGSIP